MTREDLRGIVEGITDEQLKSILDIHSADIGRAKSGAEDLKAQLSAAQNKIGEMEASVGEAEKLQLKINELQKTIDDRNASDAAKEKTKIVEERFNTAHGNASFINELTQKGLLAEFTAAVENPDNADKTDREIFNALTEGRDNLFISAEGVPTVVAASNFGGDFTDADVREIMGL